MDGEVSISCTCPDWYEHGMYAGKSLNPECTMHGDSEDAVRRRESFLEIADAMEAQRKPKTTASYSTMLTVTARDGTLRDVAVCADDTPETIGRNVVAAINGESHFQLTTLKCGECGEYATPTLESARRRHSILLPGIPSDPGLAKKIVEITFDAKTPSEEHLCCAEVEAAALTALAGRVASADGAEVFGRWKKLGHEARMEVRRSVYRFLRSLP